MLPLLFRGSFQVDPNRVADVMALNEREAIKDRRLLIICGVVLAAGVHRLHRPLGASTSSRRWWRCSAPACWSLSRSKPRDFMASVEWETLLFFAGLFVMIGALVKTGVIGQLADAAAEPPAAIRSPPPC